MAIGENSKYFFGRSPMEAYLAKDNLVYVDFLRHRYRRGSNLSAAKYAKIKNFLCEDDHIARYANGYKPADHAGQISNYETCHQKNALEESQYSPKDVTLDRYVHGKTIRAEHACRLHDTDHRDRYSRGFEIPEEILDMQYTDFGLNLDSSRRGDLRSYHKLLRKNDHINHYKNGGDLPPEKMRMLHDKHYRRRYEEGYDIPANKISLLQDDNYLCRYKEGYEIPDEKMPLISAEDRANRYENGFSGEPIAQFRAKRIYSGYEPDGIPSRLAYLLGYRVPKNIMRRLNLTERDYAIHHNLDLNEICILARADMPFAVPRELFADFEYVVGRAVPEWLELRMPTGEVAFRIDDFGRLSQRCADVITIDQICDGLCSPEWGARRVGEMRGTIYLEPPSDVTSKNVLPDWIAELTDQRGWTDSDRDWIAELVKRHNWLYRDEFDSP